MKSRVIQLLDRNTKEELCFVKTNAPLNKLEDYLSEFQEDLEYQEDGDGEVAYLEMACKSDRFTWEEIKIDFLEV